MRIFHNYLKDNCILYIMEHYICNYNIYKETIVYDFNLTNGGIGDYIKFFMIILKYCMDGNIRFYHKINNIKIEKYIKLKYDIMDITQEQLSNLDNFIVKTPYDYYDKDEYNCNIYLNEVFYFDDIIKKNVSNILSFLPNKYTSIHLRLGDNFLETDNQFIACKNDVRKFSEKKIHEIMDKNIDNIIFFCDNNNYKLEIKKKYNNIIITKAQIGHTSLLNTTENQILDAITELYILSNSEEIYGNRSGFSLMASKFKDIQYFNF